MEFAKQTPKSKANLWILYGEYMETVDYKVGFQNNLYNPIIYRLYFTQHASISTLSAVNYIVVKLIVQNNSV